MKVLCTVGIDEKYYVQQVLMKVLCTDKSIM